MQLSNSKRWIASPPLAMTSVIVLAMRCASELCLHAAKAANAFALRTDLRQMTPAVVADAVTIDASSHAMLQATYK
jgi:hypothetical protein